MGTNGEKKPQKKKKGITNGINETASQINFTLLMIIMLHNAIVLRIHTPNYISPLMFVIENEP